MSVKFGTGGWRAVIADGFTKANVQLLAAALAQKMKDEDAAENGFVIGYDRRFLSREAAQWAAEVLAGAGIVCLLIDREAPTPLVMFSVKYYGLSYGMSGDAKVSKMIEALSTVLDAALDRHKSPEVRLAEEMRYVSAYLYIIDQRFGRRLSITTDIPEALMFNLIFLYNGGMVNQLLKNLGLISKNIDWKDQSHFLFTMFMPVMWQYVGFYFVILVTGLNNISQDLYEAGALDGCTGLDRVRYITLPLLRNVLCTCLVLAITGALKVFDLPWVMFGAGMPGDKGWLTGTYMYDQTFNRGNVDYGSAIAILIVVLGVVLSNVANRVFKPRDVI